MTATRTFKTPLEKRHPSNHRAGRVAEANPIIIPESTDTRDWMARWMGDPPKGRRELIEAQGKLHARSTRDAD